MLLGCGYSTIDRRLLGYVAFAPYIADVFSELERSVATTDGILGQSKALIPEIMLV